MEDPGEPEQKRIKRITEYIEDEIVRSQHLPLEELIQHKSAMIHVLQFLNIEEAYAVSLASRRVYMWFQQNNIWYALAQRWLSPARLAQCEAWVEQVKPKGKQINYLWLLLGEYMLSSIEHSDSKSFAYVLLPDRGYISVDSSRHRDVRWLLNPHGSSAKLLVAGLGGKELNYNSGGWIFHYPLTITGLDSNLVQLTYNILEKDQKVRVILSKYSGRYPIRSKLPTY